MNAISPPTPSSEPSIPVPTSAPPMPNDPAARSATGEILEPGQIPTPPAPKPSEAPAPTSTSTEPPKPPEAKPPAEPGKAPETYAEFKAPEGYTLDPKAIEAATPIFKELGLTQDQAQRLVEFHSAQMIEAAKAPESQYAAMRTDWQAKVKADPELAKATNGNATGLDAVKLDIGRALNALGDPGLAAEFKAAMDLTGAGDHPAFVKTLWKLAGHITEGRAVTPGNPSPHGQRPPGSGDRPPAAKSLYPNLS